MGFDVLWISSAEIDTLGISMREIMDAVEAGFAALGKGQGEMPAKIGIHPREDCFIHAMPCYLGGNVDRAGIKCVSGYPSNPEKGLPYITGIMLLTDPETGIPQAVMDAGWVTAWRTGAASGVYARHFGDPATQTVSIIGTGVQGRVNLLAMKEVFPRLSRVFCHDKFDEAAERFVRDMHRELPDAEFVICPDVRTAVAEAEVLITCTPIVEAPQRFVHREWLKSDCLVISVDYDSAIHENVFLGAHFTCDNRNQYLWTRKQGAYFQNGYPGPQDMDADMGEICAGAKQGVRTGRRSAVLMGIASHDVMTAALIHELARENGLGTKVTL
ncbi:ornithine cyclodeaminase family protein [Pseudodesulfovibrio tunisiensis]|uniref:ornithine cyclodeaminase family protein n=1 Tax=Pseudodesulfovibrio tunisiensis TaxID=463192 RepID=UPI001FB32BFA|nr:ornithine cyclodeaminase family protein [Pseudodesulfovibrio tunisiensis]